MKLHALGGLSAQDFLRRHWQKKPLLARGALPGFRGVASREQLLALSSRPDVESRLVRRSGARWSVVQGPLARTALRRNSTLLVQGVNLHLAAADRLLRMFSFLPQARLDDVMVSWAAPGGGVGPHFDSYDVFLVQGAGRRVWRLQRPRRVAHQRVVWRQPRPTKRSGNETDEEQEGDTGEEILTHDIACLMQELVHDSIRTRGSIKPYRISMSRFKPTYSKAMVNTKPCTGA